MCTDLIATLLLLGPASREGVKTNVLYVSQCTFRHGHWQMHQPSQMSDPPVIEGFHWRVRYNFCLGTVGIKPRQWVAISPVGVQSSGLGQSMGRPFKSSFESPLQLALRFLRITALERGEIY